MSSICSLSIESVGSGHRQLLSHTKNASPTDDDQYCRHAAIIILSVLSPLLAHFRAGSLPPACGGTWHEPRGGEGCEADTWRTVHHQFRHHPPCDGGPQDPPAVVPRGDVGPLDPRHGPHDGKRVRRARPHARLHEVRGP
eukprot:7566943-Pyramimonas_sp.AAC.1